MIARVCYSCGIQWDAEDGNTEILCPVCRLKAELRRIADALRRMEATVRELPCGIDGGMKP